MQGMGRPRQSKASQAPGRQTGQAGRVGRAGRAGWKCETENSRIQAKNETILLLSDGAGLSGGGG